MTHNRQLTIYTATSRKTRILQAAPMTVQELFKRLEVSQTIPHTIAAYKALSKPQQDNLKDIGAYIAGELRGGRRKAGDVLTRCAAVLDADNLGPGETETFIKRVAAAGLCCCVYSTAKHSPSAPRLRVVIPFSTDLPADMYPPVIRLLCQLIQPEMTWFDPSTDEAGRIMYWGTHCQDIDPVYFTQDGTGLLDVEAWLAQQLPNWRDVTTWPRFPREQAPAKLTAKQEDPESKAGIVGAFCRCYNVPATMEKFLPGVYEATNSDDRYTFAAGSTWGGAVLYEGGKFLYSNHATDPAGGKLVNAWDLVRLHLFGGLDDEAQEGARGNRLPSFKAMTELAHADPAVSDELNRVRQQEALEAFGAGLTVSGTQDVTWMRGLTRGGKGCIEPSFANVLHVLEYDPRLKGRIYKDSFADRTIGVAPLPWGSHPNETETFEWRDADDDGVAVYLEKLVGFRAPAVIRGAFNDHLARHAFNPVTAYLNGLDWDGAPRLDTLFIDYLGADDSPYVRAVTRKSFVAAVARAFQPGIKYDTMSILSSPTGRGKSTLLDIMGGAWFTDSIRTFEGKDVSELLQGVWLAEIAELQAFSRADVERVKQFLSMRDDRFRASYGRRAAGHPRSCVFFGTTNTKTFLRDPTGGRRFWPVYAWNRFPKKSVFHDLTGERDQLWAEAVAYWRQGESLILTGELADNAKSIQEAAREAHPWEDQIRSFLEKQIPKDWVSWSIDRRRIFWNGGALGDLELVPRERVCAVEIWCELLECQLKDLTQEKSRSINTILENTPGWERLPNRKYFGPHGQQRGFYRVPITGQ